MASRLRPGPGVWAGRAFGVAALAAVPVLRYQNRGQWFFLDEWDFVAARSLTSPASLTEPHAEHWTSLPAVVYRLLHRAVGLNHYWPYQAVAIASHLGVAALVRLALLRSRADPWIATALGVVLLFLGAGRSNVASGFQITFTGALGLGLAQMLLADHDGRSRRRDAAAVLCGLGAIMCSGVGVAMAVGVGVAVLLRRGLRMALVQTAPLAAAFVVWYLVEEPSDRAAGFSTPRSVAIYATDMVTHAFVATGRTWTWAAILALLVVAGLASALWARRIRAADDDTTLVARVPPLVAGTLVSVVVFAVSTALSRSGLGDSTPATATRYVYVVVALTFPAIGVALSLLARDRTWRRVAVVAFLLLVVPANIAALAPQGTDRFTTGREAFWSEAAALARDRAYPASYRPSPDEAPEVTMGWLAEAVAAGRMPVATEVRTPSGSRLLLGASLSEGPAPREEPCRRRSAGRLVLERGEQVRTRSDRVTVTPTGQPAQAALAFSAPAPVVLTVVRGPIDVRVRVPPGTPRSLLVCG